MIDENRLIEELFYKMPSQFGAIAMDWFRDLVDSQPKVYDDWIPCNECLPKKGEKVLLQDYYSNVEIGRFEQSCLVNLGFRSDDWFSYTKNYLAWRPLPELYKENKNKGENDRHNK